MSTNLYGPGDNFHPENSYVIPVLVLEFHEAKVSGASSVTVWGTGTPRRKFLYSDDMAAACVFLMNFPDKLYLPILAQDRNDGMVAPLINLGVGEDVTIRELAKAVGQVACHEGAIVFDSSRPAGTMRKLLDIGRSLGLGWHAETGLMAGLRCPYLDFLKQQ